MRERAAWQPWGAGGRAASPGAPPARDPSTHAARPTTHETHPPQLDTREVGTMISARLQVGRPCRRQRVGRRML